MSLSANFEAHSLGNYRNFNNSLKKPCNLARRSYIRNLAEEVKENNNLKPFWSFVTSARKGTNNLVSPLVDGVTLTDDLSIAQNLNQFYSSVFTSEDCDNFLNFHYVVTSKLSNITIEFMFVGINMLWARLRLKLRSRAAEF